MLRHTTSFPGKRPWERGCYVTVKHLGKLSLNFSTSSFVIHVYLPHPLSSSFLYALVLSLWCFTILVSFHFQASFIEGNVVHSPNNLNNRFGTPFTDHKLNVALDLQAGV